MYDVVKVYRDSGRRTILHEGVSLKEAKRLTQSYPSPEDRSYMVVFTEV